METKTNSIEESSKDLHMCMLYLVYHISVHLCIHQPILFYGCTLKKIEDTSGFHKSGAFWLDERAEHINWGKKPSVLKAWLKEKKKREKIIVWSQKRWDSLVFEKGESPLFLWDWRKRWWWVGNFEGNLVWWPQFFSLK